MTHNLEGPTKSEKQESARYARFIDNEGLTYTIAQEAHISFGTRRQLLPRAEAAAVDPNGDLWVLEQARRAWERPLPNFLDSEAIIPYITIYTLPSKILKSIHPYFPHISSTSPELIAYTPTAKHGRERRTVVARPGKFFKFALTNSPYTNNLSQEHIEVLVKLLATEYNIYVAEGILHFARTAEEIYRIYMEGPYSCMQKPPEYWYLPPSQHPTNVYGDSDLSVAYITAKHNPNRILARTIVSESRKAFSILYGHREALSRALIKLGYRFNPTLLGGQRIKAIRIKYEHLPPQSLPQHVKGVKHTFLMPFIDNFCHGNLELSETQSQSQTQTQSKEVGDCGWITLINPQERKDYPKVVDVDSSTGLTSIFEFTCTQCGASGWVTYSDYYGCDSIPHMCEHPYHTTAQESKPSWLL